MNFYSEALITSFFPRITASKKRKTHTELTPPGSSNKRRGDSLSRSGGSTAKSKNKDEQECRSALDNGTPSTSHLPSQSVDDLSVTQSTKGKGTRQQTSERHMPLISSLSATNVTPQTSKSPSRKKAKTFLQTPPPTNEGAKRQRLMELTPTLPPFISRESPDVPVERVLFPTPSTMGRLTLRHNRHSGNNQHRVVQGQDLSSPTRSKHSDTSLRTAVSISVPSSQSQLMVNTYSEHEHHLTPAGTALPCKEQLPQYEGQPSSPNRIPLNRRDKGDSISHASQMFVSSSQSQILSLLDEHDNPQRSSIGSNPDLDVISSSQSQEKELRISTGPEEYPSICSRKQALPQRTLSDELFSIPVLQAGWLKGSLQPSEGTANIPCAANDDDDSTTEPETEPETEEKNPTSMQSQPYRLSQLPTANLAFVNEDSQYKYPCNSQQSLQDLSLADQASSLASLPSAVKEFQSMFGSDDESYPSDFPMSLR